MTKTLKTKQRCRRKPIPEWCTPSQWIYITINTQYTNWTGSVQTHSPGDRQPDQNRKENQSQRSRHREVKDTATPYGPNISFQSKSKWSGSDDQNQKEGVMGTIPKLPTYSVIQWNPNTKSIIKGATHNLSGKLVNIGILSSSGPFPKYGSKFCPWNKIKFIECIHWVEWRSTACYSDNTIISSLHHWTWLRVYFYFLDSHIHYFRIPLPFFNVKPSPSVKLHSDREHN